MSLVGAVLGLGLTPFLTIGRQGHRPRVKAGEDEKKEGGAGVEEKHEGGVV